MIHDIDRLPEYERAHVTRLIRYLDIQGVDPASYWIGPSDKIPPAGDIPRARFTGERDEQADTIALLDLPFATPQPALLTGLPRAVRYIVHLLGEAGVSDRLRTLDVTADDAHLLDRLDIDTAQVCRASVKPWAAGSFLAPDGDGFTYFMVEERGALVRLAHSAALAPVAWAFAADADMQRTNLSGRIGKVVSAAIRR